MPRNYCKYEQISSSQLSSARVMLHAQASYADVPVYWFKAEICVPMVFSSRCRQCLWFERPCSSLTKHSGSRAMSKVTCMEYGLLLILSPRTHSIRPNDIFVLCHISEMHTQERAARCCMR